MRKILPLLTVGLLGLPLSAQKVEFEKYTLDNGLQVILHEDHSLPTVCINIWYHVGSKDEAPGRSGFAHLFEHLMFMGTKRVPGAGFDQIMERGGGANNASTSQDRTNYYSLGPSTLLETLLWLDADRMEDFGKSMTQPKLDKQREVVRNERRQVVEMRPYGKAEERLGSYLYPSAHPYHTSVIGSHEDLEAATLQDVKDFFATYYVPNNASLVVAGDFDPEKIKPRIAEWFGTIPRGPEVLPRRAPDFALGETRRVTLTDRVQFARLGMVWTTPRVFAPGDAEMDILSNLLTEGKSSRLYKRLVYEDKLAVRVTVYQSSQYLGSQFRITAMARPGVSLDEIERAIDEELGRLRSEAPTAAEVERAKISLEYATVNGLQSLRQRADALNRYNFHLATPDGFQRDLERYRKATTESVRDWTAKLLRDDARLIMRVLPLEAQAKNPRDEQPKLDAAKAFAPQLPETFTLSNGIRVHHWERKELPLVRLVLHLGGGAAADPKGKGGATSLMAAMLDEGAGERSALDFSDALANLGASFGAGADRHSVQLSLQALKTQFDPALSLFADAALRPRFDPKEWDRVKTLHLRGLEQQQDNPAQLARLLGSRVFFGSDHPYGHPIGGLVPSVERLSLEDVKAIRKRVFVPGRATFFVAGDLTAVAAKTALEQWFGGWRGSSQDRAEPAVPPAPRDAMRVRIVHRPGAVQTVIRFMMPGPRYEDPGRVTYEAINTVLGGSFTSRLNQNLREKHGFTYGARSGFAMWPTTGMLMASSSVQAEVTRRALEEFLKELRGVRAATITDDEAGKARATNRQNLVATMEGLAGLLGVATTLHDGGLEFAALARQLGDLEKLDAKTMNALCAKAVPLDRACLLLVGDKKVILEQLEGLGLPSPVELDVRGEPVPGR